MRLEDALLHVEVRLDAGALSGAALTCEQIVDGGGDVIHVVADAALDGLAGALQSMAAVCRRDDALLVIRDHAELAGAVDGVHLSRADMSLAMARARAGDGKLVGITSATLDEATLALEVGADYLLHAAGSGCVGAFAVLRGMAAVPLVAAGLASFEEARAVVESGIFRLAVSTVVLGEGDTREAVAAYSRLLGRSL